MALLNQKTPSTGLGCSRSWTAMAAQLTPNHRPRSAPMSSTSATCEKKSVPATSVASTMGAAST